MHIDVPMPAAGQFDEPATWEAAITTIRERSPDVVSLADAAFLRDDEASWSAVQQMLYHWNLDELERKAPVTDLSRMVRQGLRNAILEVQVRATQPSGFGDRFDHFTPDHALEVLREEALGHRINTHPLLEELGSHGLSADSIQLFLDNYYVNNRVFHLHIAAQSLSAPFEMRAEMYQNLYDELGTGEPDQAHPLLFLESYRSLTEPEVIRPLPGSLCLLNTKIFHTFLCGNYLEGVGGLGFLELAMPAQMEKIFVGLQKSGLPREDLRFWELHITLDQEHGEHWFDEMRPFVQSRENARAILRGGLGILEARSVFYDDVWASVLESEKYRSRRA